MREGKPLSQKRGRRGSGERLCEVESQSSVVKVSDPGIWGAGARVHGQQVQHGRTQPKETEKEKVSEYAV